MSKRSRDRRDLKALGVPARPGSLYELALTHRSFAYEQPDVIEHNERLEFLGDAILGLIVTDLLYRTYPEMSEGKMSELRGAVVSKQALAELARDLGIGDHIRLGRGERASGGAAKPSLLAATFEALLAALYLDRGRQAVEEFVIPIFKERLADALADRAGFDPKNELQELIAKRIGDLPQYRLTSTGPEHDKRFGAHVYVADELRGVGWGRSKKEAEQNAAREALLTFDEEEPGARAG